MQLNANKPLFQELPPLPKEIEREILSYFNPVELAKICTVSKAFNHVASSHDVMKNAFPMLSEIKRNDEKIDIKKEISGRTCKTADEVIKLFRKFVENVPTGESWTFSCYFPLNPIPSGSTNHHQSYMEIKAFVEYPEKSEQVNVKAPIKGSCIVLKKIPGSMDDILPCLTQIGDPGANKNIKRGVVQSIQRENDNIILHDVMTKIHNQIALDISKEVKSDFMSVEQQKYFTEGLEAIKERKIL